MKYLYRNNYKPLTIQEYIDCIYGKIPVPRRPILITLDDGYGSVRSRAYTTLKKYGFPAVVFVSCDYIGMPTSFPEDRQIWLTSDQVRRELMPLTWQQIRDMGDIISVGSHTMSHPHLALLTEEDIRREVTESKALIEQQLGKEVLSFSYPGGIRQYGDFSDLTRRILIDAGYKIAFNSEIGRNSQGSDPYVQRRIYVEDRDSTSLFEAKLVGAYDWTRMAQWCFQRLLPEQSRH